MATRVVRALAIGTLLSLLGLGAFFALTACTIERVVLYETINYPLPRPTS